LCRCPAGRQVPYSTQYKKAWYDQKYWILAVSPVVPAIYTSYTKVDIYAMLGSRPIKFIKWPMPFTLFIWRLHDYIHDIHRSRPQYIYYYIYIYTITLCTRVHSHTYVWCTWHVVHIAYTCTYMKLHMWHTFIHERSHTCMYYIRLDP
jgi:hypothetical protein